MGFKCNALNEHVSGQGMVLVPVVQRAVKYNNYAVSMKGGKVIKQFMGTTEGFETVKEVPVCASEAEGYILTHAPDVAEDVKMVTFEYNLHPISHEAMSAAIEKNNVVVIEKIREPDPVSELSTMPEYGWNKDNE